MNTEQKGLLPPYTHYKSRVQTILARSSAIVEGRYMKNKKKKEEWSNKEILLWVLFFMMLGSGLFLLFGYLNRRY